MFLNSIPGVGHLKGLYHYVTGDVVEGNRAMVEATRTTLVVGGGIVGSVGGPGLAALGATATGVFVDGVATLLTQESQGVARGIENIVTDIKNGEVPVKSVLVTGVMVGADAVSGVGAGTLASGITRSAGKSIGKSVAEDVTKKLVQKQCLNAVMCGPVVRNMAENTAQESSSGTGNGGAGSQPPNNNQNKKQKKKDEENKALAEFLEIFGVKSLDEICIRNKYIFKGLNEGQKTYLMRLIIKITNSGYDLKHVVKIVLKLFDAVIAEESDISYGNFITFLNFVHTYIGDLVTQELANEYIANRDVSAHVDRRQRLPTEVVRNLLKEISDDANGNRMTVLVKNLQSRVKKQPVIDPNFKNIFSAIYHYYKHRNECNPPLTIEQYFSYIKNLIERLRNNQTYLRLGRQEENLLTFQRYEDRFQKRIKLVLKVQNGKVVISSCYFVDAVYDKDKDGDEFVNDKKI